jgi:biopolymer transport protein ExbD
VGNKDNIRIEADSKLKYGRLVEVMDACLGAGFKSVGFAPPPDLKR